MQCGIATRNNSSKHLVLGRAGPAVQGPNTGKGINRGCMVGEWEVKCKFKAQCKATEGTQK